jgi:hypothetical protein
MTISPLLFKMMRVLYGRSSSQHFFTDLILAGVVRLVSGVLRLMFGVRCRVSGVRCQAFAAPESFAEH